LESNIITKWTGQYLDKAEIMQHPRMKTEILMAAFPRFVKKLLSAKSFLANLGNAANVCALIRLYLSKRYLISKKPKA